MFKRQKLEYIYGYFAGFNKAARISLMNINIKNVPIVEAHSNLVVSLGFNENNLPECKFSNHYDKGYKAGLRDFANIYVYGKTESASILMRAN